MSYRLVSEARENGIRWYRIYRQHNSSLDRETLDYAESSKPDFKERILHMTEQLERFIEMDIFLMRSITFYHISSLRKLEEYEQYFLDTVSRLCDTPTSLQTMLTTYLADLPCYGSAFCDILCGIKRTICRHALCSRLPTSLKAAVENHRLRRSGHKRFTDMCEFHTPCYWKCHWKSFEEKEDPPPMYLSQRICDCTDTNNTSL